MLNHFLAIETAGPLHTPSHWLIRYHDVVLMVFGMVGFLADSLSHLVDGDFTCW